MLQEMPGKQAFFKKSMSAVLGSIFGVNGGNRADFCRSCEKTRKLWGILIDNSDALF